MEMSRRPAPLSRSVCRNMVHILFTEIKFTSSCLGKSSLKSQSAYFPSWCRIVADNHAFAKIFRFIVKTPCQGKDCRYHVIEGYTFAFGTYPTSQCVSGLGTFLPNTVHAGASSHGSNIWLSKTSFFPTVSPKHDYLSHVSKCIKVFISIEACKVALFKRVSSKPIHALRYGIEYTWYYICFLFLLLGFHPVRRTCGPPEEIQSWITPISHLMHLLPISIGGGKTPASRIRHICRTETPNMSDNSFAFSSSLFISISSGCFIYIAPVVCIIFAVFNIHVKSVLLYSIYNVPVLITKKQG